MEPPEIEAWDAWHPREVRDRLDGVDARWCVAAGWAIELFLAGAYSREHSDLEIAVPRARFAEVAARFAELDVYVPSAGRVTPLAEAGDLFDVQHQTWFFDRDAGAWRIDVFREPHDGDTWICRRDESLRRPYAEVIAHTDGIPYMQPELVLLFKAKHANPKDDADLAAALPRLTGEQHAWLRDALARVHPGHRWLDEVG